ncbi:hypothetical protein GCM10028805_26040 [Spirosoma harenae]
MNTNNALANLLFEQENDFLSVYDIQQDRYIRVNQAGIRLLGYPSEQVLLDQINPSVRSKPLSYEEEIQTIAQLVQNGYHEEETEIIRYDGETFWGRLKLTMFPSGQLVLLRITNLDQLHRMEKALENNTQRNEAIFANATIGIIVCNQQGHIVSANQMANQLFGYEEGELIADNIESVVPTGVSKYHEKLRKTFNDNPQVRAMGHNRDLYAQRKNGSVFPVEVSLSYFRLEGELYAVAYIIDITIKKEAEKQLLEQKAQMERLNAELEQKVIDRTQALLSTLSQLEKSKEDLTKALATERELGELKSRFVSMASHEFRTPLTTVLTSTNLIEKYPGGDQQDKRQKHLDRIRSSVKHLTDILEEFLSVGKLEEGKLDVQSNEVDVGQLVTNTVADLQGMLKPNQTVQTHLSCINTIWLDVSMLRKMLNNLLSNAIKYSGPGTVVIIRATCLLGQLILSIQDQGIGISSNDQQHLFERFFRAKNATNIAGTGLGLHIVGRYVALMGGEVSLESELNRGTTVTVILPYENHSTD